MRVLRVSHSSVVDAWRERERALGARGHDIELVTAEVWDEGGSAVRLVKRPGERVTGARTLGRHPALFLYDPRPLWRLLGHQWDVIDIQEEPFALATAEVLLLRLLRRQRAPFILYSAQNLEKRYPIPFRWLESWSLRAAAGISVCNAAAGQIASRKGLRGQAMVIPLGTDLEHFRPDDEPRTVTARGWDGPIRVGYAGRLEPHKGIGVLVDAVAADERLSLFMAGGGSSEAALRTRITAAELGGRIHLLGAVRQADLPTFYRGVDIIAVPSLTTPSWVEQFGRVAVEAMACGTPVVASDSGALPDVVDGAGRLVPPGDAQALRDALVEVGTNPDLASRLRAVGRERASTTGWERVAEQYENLYLRTRPPALRPKPSDLMPRVEIVVVAFGAAGLLRQALEPVRDELVTVVDNSSSPAVRAVCEDLGVAYHDSGHNGGFAAGVNEGLRRSHFPDSDVLLLNPDAVIKPDAIRTLQAALRSAPDLASVSPRLVGPTGDEDRAAWPFPTPGRTWLEAIGLGRRAPDEYVVGAALLLRAEAIEEVGPLDERFFLYAEETDWAWRAGLLGWRHELVPAVTALHVGAGTSINPARREAHFHAGQERYYRKNFGGAGWASARTAQLAGSSLRSLLPGERGSMARRRVLTYLRGPMRVERLMVSDGSSTGAPS